ncbi:LysR substrate-binding domain-containing protein [Dyella caseinilytica]|uniref:LysR family transcriptional regulator n=1 Tax=Dyella caseinilytica TaxID=1849581 RepID=A0ABX7GZ65_9GAMM|nr:LysR substrate-binding domain-containing protein [Dyella caseinilytica]QRN55318.1 LysR family transcriptional regulator [Dyella caseinilytica]GGA00930.1 transcriptional regulator [Dyella caseinilytica]
MLDLNDLFLFVHVVDRGGFTAASRTLGIPKSTLSHRMQKLESDLGVRLLNRTTRQFGTTDAGGEIFTHAMAMLREAERAEDSIKQRLIEPKGTVRFTAGLVTMQFALDELVSGFLQRHPKVNVVAHATDDYVDIVGENFDVAIRGHSDPLPSSTMIQRTLAPVPWYLFAGANYFDAQKPPQSPADLHKHPSLFMMRGDVSPVWHLRHSTKRGEAATIKLAPRLLSDDITALKRAAVDGVGIVALPGYSCRAELRSGALRRVLPTWIAGDSTLTAVMSYRHGRLPSVNAFLDFLAAELPAAVSI